MKIKRLIPCLDVRDGRVVKGIRFQGLRDMGDPTELARRYEEQGADELVVLDVSATVRDVDHDYPTIRSMRSSLSIPLTVGGGVRQVRDAEKLLRAGADKVAVNSAAVASPELVTTLASNFGSQCTVVAIDAAQTSSGQWQVLTHSGGKQSGFDLVDWVREVEQRGAGEVLLTSWDRDGTRSGYDLPMLQAVTRAVRLPVIASGGANSPGHLLEAIDAGADAVLAASIFHEGQYDVSSLKDWLSSQGIGVRPHE